MFDVAELKRKLKNMVRVTSIVTPNKENKALATVRVGESDETAEFPVLSFANSFKKHWIPIRADEQVLVIFPFGNANKGFIVRSIFWKEQKEPDGADADIEVIEYSDGARFTYSTKSGEMTVTGVQSLVLNAKSLAVTGKTTFNGSVNIAGTLKVSGDILSGGQVSNGDGRLL